LIDEPYSFNERIHHRLCFVVLHCAPQVPVVGM
jgi:hypothetical protein